ncbi:MAG: hypothetical protein ACK5ZW_00975 [Betaproteobacteria bacterium]
MKPSESADRSRAAARVLALALLADGRLSAGERAALQCRQPALRRLGVAPELLDLEVQSCSAQLLAARDPDWDGPCLPGPQALRQVLAEIGDRDDRHRLFRVCADLAESDGELSEGEFRLLAAALEQWGIHRGMLALDEAGRSLARGRA